MYKKDALRKLSKELNSSNRKGLRFGNETYRREIHYFPVNIFSDGSFFYEFDLQHGEIRIYMDYGNYMYIPISIIYCHKNFGITYQNEENYEKIH